MSDSGRAAAWLVLSSVAKGVGLGDCAFHSTPDTSFLWRPALDGLNENQILILNRVVTKNYRDAERSGRIVVADLYPVTRQVVALLTTPSGEWDCSKVAEV